MTTATITKCPEWCESKKIEGHARDGHDGPNWPTLRNDRAYLQISARMNEKGQAVVNVDTNTGDLTPEQAIQAGQYLIEAGQWALAHRVA